jgi:hypothetical protein
VGARVAVNAHEAVGENAATKVSPKLLLDVARQGRGIRVSGVLDESFETLAHDLVKDRLGGSSRTVGRRQRCHEDALLGRIVPGSDCRDYASLDCVRGVGGRPTAVRESDRTPSRAARDRDGCAPVRSSLAPAPERRVQQCSMLVTGMPCHRACPRWAARCILRREWHRAPARACSSPAVLLTSAASQVGT